MSTVHVVSGVIMEKPCLNDENEYPDDAVLERHLGTVKTVWDMFVESLQNNYQSVAGEWRYYNDGKNWLFKVPKKKKTLCWVAVFEGFFKVGCYFSDKAEPLIIDSSLPQEYKDQFLTGKRYGKIRAVNVTVTGASALDAVGTLLGIKEGLK
jgi:hypothetical protein